MDTMQSAAAPRKSFGTWMRGCACKNITTRAYGQIPLRVLMGIVFILHGASKLPGGTPGITGFTGFLTSLNVPMPEIMAWVVLAVELLGGIALLAGAWTRVFAALISVNMLVAWSLTKLDNGLLSKGIVVGELDLALMFIAISLVLTGAGPWSVDQWACRRHPKA
jgi:putative oxidoreductase